MGVSNLAKAVDAANTKLSTIPGWLYSSGGICARLAIAICNELMLGGAGIKAGP